LPFTSTSTSKSPLPFFSFPAAASFECKMQMHQGGVAVGRFHFRAFWQNFLCQRRGGDVKGADWRGGEIEEKHAEELVRQKGGEIELNWAKKLLQYFLISFCPSSTKWLGPFTLSSCGLLAGADLPNRDAPLP
jgi:hypothetical protein